MKKANLVFIIFFTFLLFSGVNAQTPEIDTVAVRIIERVQLLFSNNNAISFNIKTSYDVISDELGLVKHNDNAMILANLPNKLLIESNGDKGHFKSFYNGSKLCVYNYEKNRFATLNAPKSIAEMVDELQFSYGMEFPAADFFYPNFVDDVLESVEKLSYLGISTIDGKECYHIAARTPDNTWQLWVEKSLYELPVRFVVVYDQAAESPQYQADFENWNLNAIIAKGLFEFIPPPNAMEVKMIKKNE